MTEARTRAGPGGKIAVRPYFLHDAAFGRVGKTLAAQFRSSTDMPSSVNKITQRLKAIHIKEPMPVGHPNQVATSAKHG